MAALGERITDRLTPSLVFLAFLVYGCSDEPGVAGVLRRISDRPLFSLMTSCGVSFTATVTGSDPELESYGVVRDTFAFDVCVTWTGSDYQAQATVRSSNSPELEARDAAPTVVYDDTYVEAYGGGGQFQNREYVGSSAFEYVDASAAEIQTSYDDPYYAVRSSGGGGGGGDCETGCALAYPLSVEVVHPAAASQARDSPPLRHGLSRRGVRYLVNDLEEIAPASNGNRRFRGTRGDSEVTIELERGTELMVGVRKQPRDSCSTTPQRLFPGWA